MTPSSTDTAPAWQTPTRSWTPGLFVRPPLSPACSSSTADTRARFALIGRPRWRSTLRRSTWHVRPKPAGRTCVPAHTPRSASPSAVLSASPVCRRQRKGPQPDPPSVTSPQIAVSFPMEFTTEPGKPLTVNGRYRVPGDDPPPGAVRRQVISAFSAVRRNSSRRCVTAVASSRLPSAANPGNPLNSVGVFSAAIASQ